MPLVQITMVEGNGEEKKRALIAKVTDAVAESLDAPVALVRVLISEIPSANWGVGGVSMKDRGH